ncbi:MAG: hypothetical protein PHR64_03360 [Candidatus Shapirobacteria bacterium]|nr:hypothetical protein [Candidatus Shapirobacteria bacterium]MDD5481948.1 hypothetical protein [Candidatus Shapirobacteria bacterium]
MGDLGEPMPGAVPVEAVKKGLIDSRTISKETDPEGRVETARAVIGVRAETRANQEVIADTEQKIQHIAELAGTLYQQERQKNEELARRLGSVLVRAKGLIGIDDKQAASLQAEIAAIEEERSALYAQSDNTEHELADLGKRQTEIPNPRQLIEAYYEKISTQPLSNEQKRALLTPEVLASLTTEEYIALWRRLNPYFLAHVTRQGFRDHTGEDMMVNHASGYREYVSGFVDVMENGQCLFPPLARVGLVNRDEATVKSFLSSFFEQAENADQAREMFKNFLSFGLAAAPKYPDITATHFAAQTVLDGYYGGERGNEVFFVYPSDVLASQYPYAFNGKEKDFTEPQSENKWNDVFIWTDPENPGIPVDSGIVFLPDTRLVDPETGSRYASEMRTIDGQERRVMIENTDLVASFVEWGKKLDAQSPLARAFAAYKKERDYYNQQDLERECVTTFTQELINLGFEADASSLLTNRLMGEMHRKDSLDEEALQGIVRGAGAHFKMAERTIPARDYWENFFAENPDLRPKHVVYYDGSPTAAVFKFQQQNGIGKADTSEENGPLLGFDDHRVVNMGEDSRSNVGYEELLATANKIIDEHYGSAGAEGVIRK